MEVFGRAKEDWLKSFFQLLNGIPSHDTFNRVFSALNPECGSGDASNKSIVHKISAWAAKNHIAVTS